MSDYQYGYDGQTADDMRLKMRLGWRSHGHETDCGQGSEYGMTVAVRNLLPIICGDYNIQSVLDAGAGDLNWMSLVKWPNGVSFRAFDLVPRHPDVEEFDITTQIPPKVDLIICRHVLNHLSVRHAVAAVNNFGDSRSRYLLVTTCENQTAYWAEHGYRFREPIASWRDCTKWTLELHALWLEGKTFCQI